MKKFFTAVIFIITIAQVGAQDNGLLNQYFQSMPVLNPALAGANEYLDLNLGVRQQWVGFEGAPSTTFISGYGMIGSGKKASGFNPVATSFASLKQGVGGNVIIDDQGPFKETEVNLTYAVHVPINSRTYLCMGLTPGIYNAKVDFTEVGVGDPSDAYYNEHYVANGGSGTYFNLSGGMALYSDKYYVGYSMMQLTRTLLSGNERLKGNDPRVSHQLVGGYRFNMNQDFEMLPAGFVRMEGASPSLWDLGVRVRYQQRIWIGTSYRNNKSLIGMAGLLYKEKFRIGYSYGHTMAGVDNFNSGSHEIVLGVRFFEGQGRGSLW